MAYIRYDSGGCCGCFGDRGYAAQRAEEESEGDHGLRILQRGYKARLHGDRGRCRTGVKGYRDHKLKAFARCFNKV